MTRTVLFRADADPKMGTGHIMRCLALVEEAKKRNCRVLFMTRCRIPALLEKIRRTGAEVLPFPEKSGIKEDLLALSANAMQSCADWLVLDGYAFDSHYQQSLRSEGRSLLVIDDYGHAGEYDADLLMNQNLSAEPGIYKKRSLNTRMLLGTRYALIREEFRKAAKKTKENQKNILVTFGGSDPSGMTLKTVKALQKIGKLQVKLRVVSGAANPDTLKIAREMQNLPFPSELLQNPRMPELMSQADLAITAGGSTCWELAFKGVPMITVACAENQRAIAEALGRSGAAQNLGWHAAVTPGKIVSTVTKLIQNQKKLKQMAARAKKLVDGRGAARVLDEMDL